MGSEMCIRDRSLTGAHVIEALSSTAPQAITPTPGLFKVKAIFCPETETTFSVMRVTPAPLKVEFICMPVS